MKSQYTIDANGEATDELISAPKVTVGYELGLTQYGRGEKADIHVQVPLDADADEADVERETRAAFAFAKTTVLKALRVPFTLGEDGQPVYEIPEPTVEKKSTGPRSGGAARRSSAPQREAKAAPQVDSDDRVAQAWADIVSNPGGWFDNRTSKKNPKQPDFKAKEGNSAFHRGGPRGAFAVWINDDTPTWALDAIGELI